jgi:transcriptional regulator with XRE-family HTH domain
MVFSSLYIMQKKVVSILSISGAMLKFYRTLSGMSQHQVAEKLHKQPTQYNRYESGEYKMKPQLLETFSYVLNVPLTEFFEVQGKFKQFLEINGIEIVCNIEDTEVVEVISTAQTFSLLESFVILKR